MNECGVNDWFYYTVFPFLREGKTVRRLPVFMHLGGEVSDYTYDIYKVHTRENNYYN